MALYFDFLYINHSEFILSYLAIFVACLALINALSSYISCMLRPDDLGKDINNLAIPWENINNFTQLSHPLGKYK